MAAPVNPAQESVAVPQLDWVSNAINVGGLPNSSPDVLTAATMVAFAATTCEGSELVAAGSSINDALIAGTAILILPSVAT